MVYVSIVISSRNRGAALARTLDSLVSERNLSLRDWELIIIDNASTDDTGEVCARYSRRFPAHIRTLSYPLKGKSRALNFGLSRVSGNIIAFADDDVVFASGYLDGIRQTFADQTIGAAQGRMLLEFEAPPPAWFDEELATRLGLADLGDKVIEIRRNLFGANMVVRRDVIAHVGGFSPELGAGTFIGYREDAEFSGRIHAAAFKVVYAPSIAVTHLVSLTWFDPQRILSRCYMDGRAEAYLHAPEVPLWRYFGYVVKLSLTTPWRTSATHQRHLWSRAGFVWQHILYRLGKSRKLTGGNIFPVGTDAQRPSQRTSFS